jgi:anti-sigma B factor antagonist
MEAHADAHRVVALSGEIDAHNADDVCLLLREALDSSTTRLTADLARITYMGSAGVRCLLAVNQEARDRGITFLVARPSVAVEQLIAMTGIAGVLNVQDE